MKKNYFVSKLFIDNMICKVFMKRSIEFHPGFYVWNFGFAVGKSNRQLNDWYWEKKNKRCSSLKLKLIGKSGLKFIRYGYEEVLKLRWEIAPGDLIIIDCTSAEPEKQFRAFHRWQRKHPETFIDEKQKLFIWHRPPHYMDPVWKKYKIIGKVPKSPSQSISRDRYLQCFDTEPLNKNYHDIMLKVDIPKFDSNLIRS